MMKSYLNKLPIALLACLFLIAIASWVGNVYGLNCRNVLSTDGLRWWLSKFMDILNEAPWILIAMTTAAAGLLVESGIWRGLKQRKSLKQKRAFTFVGVVVLLMVFVVVYLIALPGNQFLSAFGTFDNSPLQKGFCPLLVMVMVLIAGIYGYAAGRFLNFKDFIDALVWLPKKIAPYFITLCVAAQLVAVLTFTFFTDYLPGNPLPNVIVVLQWLLYGVPLVLYVFIALKNEL